MSDFEQKEKRKEEKEKETRCAQFLHRKVKFKGSSCGVGCCRRHITVKPAVTRFSIDGTICVNVAAPQITGLSKSTVSIKR